MIPEVPSWARESTPMPKPSTLPLVEVAELLGVTWQRAHQIADVPGFPARIERDGRGRPWKRREVTAWAKIGVARSPGVSDRSATEIRAVAIRRSGPR